MNKKTAQSYIVSLLVGVLLLVGFSVFIPNTNTKALAQTYTYDPSTFSGDAIHYLNSYSQLQGRVRDIYIPSDFTLNSPVPPSIATYRTGQDFMFSLDFFAGYCANGINSLYMYRTDPVSPDTTVTNDMYSHEFIGGRSIANTSDHNDYDKAYSYNRRMTAPSTPGVYRIYFIIVNSLRWSIGATGQAAYHAYIEFEVADDVPPVDPPVQPTSTPSCVGSSCTVCPSGNCTVCPAGQKPCGVRCIPTSDLCILPKNPIIDFGLRPSIVADEDGLCTAFWDIDYNPLEIGGILDAVGSDISWERSEDIDFELLGIKVACSLNGSVVSPFTSSASVGVGLHSMSCTYGNAEYNRYAYCRLAPQFEEF